MHAEEATHRGVATCCDQPAVAIDLHPGRVVAGRYRIERVLADGGMGTVVVATHLALGHRFALKLLHHDLAAVGPLCDRFFDEARIAAAVPGDHVIRAIDAGCTEDGAPYLAMELLPGSDLGAILGARGRLPTHEAIDYVLQACEGVAELHVEGIVHRDLKPENLFLTSRRDGSALVKVLDFGVATRCHPGGSRTFLTGSSACGTPAYMAPEEIDGRSAPDPRSDQYGLAVVLYELIAGVSPFGGDSVRAVLANVCTRRPASLCDLVPGVPPAVSAAVSRALAKQPAERFADLGEFAQALSPYGSSRAVFSALNVATTLGKADVPGAALPCPSDLEPTVPVRASWARRRAWQLCTDAAVAIVTCVVVVALGSSVVAASRATDAEAAAPRSVAVTRDGRR